MANTENKQGKEVKNEKSKETGRYVKKGTDKQFPKETAITTSDRPATYKKRTPVAPEPAPVFPSEPVARQNELERNQAEQSTREFDPNNVVTDEQAYLNNDQVLPPQIVRTPTDDGQ